MNNNFKLIWISICFLLLGLIISFIVRPYLPEFIPNTPFNINGLILATLLITTVIVVSKKIYKKNDKSSYFQIILPAVFVVFFSELIFQILRQISMGSESFIIRLITIGRAVLFLSVFGAIISFLSAFQLKTKKTGYLIALIIGIIICINIFLRIFI